MAKLRWRIEVIADTEEWLRDATRFSTRRDAVTYARAMQRTWPELRMWRVVQADDPELPIGDQ